MKNLLIKLNDLVVDISTSSNGSKRKAAEFFLGRMLNSEEDEKCNSGTSQVDPIDCLQVFLESKQVYLRREAITKKYNEYFVGKEFSGLISECRPLISKRLLSKLSKGYNLSFLAVMDQEQASFLAKKCSITQRIIASDSVSQGIENAKKLLPSLTYVSNDKNEKSIATEVNVPFIGVNIEGPEIKTVPSLEEL